MNKELMNELHTLPKDHIDNNDLILYRFGKDEGEIEMFSVSLDSIFELYNDLDEYWETV